MARRASSGLNPGIILGVVVVIGVVIFGGRQLLTRESEAFKGIPRLQVDDLLQNGNALRSNVYVIEGEIDEKIKFSSRGQLVSVKVSGSSGDEFIGIEIPAAFSDRNIETKQKYAFKVEFQKGGVAVAQDIQRL